MLRKYRITYVIPQTTRKPPQHYIVEVKAYSKYSAKKRFYALYPQNEIIKIEDLKENQNAR